LTSADSVGLLGDGFMEVNATAAENEDIRLRVSLTTTEGDGVLATWGREENQIKITGNNLRKSFRINPS